MPICTWRQNHCSYSWSILILAAGSSIVPFQSTGSRCAVKWRRKGAS
jgi:hypothetical protein